MTEHLKQKLNDSAVLRWSVLALVAFTMLCGYFLTDVMSPLKPMLEKELLWDSLDYGFFTSAYGWFNVFLLMLIFGGIILDKMGVRFTGMGACLLMVFGCGLKYYAISTTFPEGAMLFGFKTQVTLAALGYAIFGVGVEIAGITVSKIIVKWFKGKEMALAMGLEMATARIGTTLAMDASLDAEGLEPEEPFRMKDIVYIITNKGFWLIALLCVLFYSAVFPFIKYAADLMVQKYNVDPKLAGTIPGLLPIGAIILTPLFGSLYDRIGKGATLMIIGSVMLIFVHTMFALPILNIWWFATIIMIILGFAFSLVPSAMWPSVPKIIPEKQLGTAYALIFWVQNWGLMGVPLLIGWVLNTYCKGPVVDGAQTYDYTLPMAIFALFGVLALIVALMLKAENKKKGYGLEEANIQK